jgi:pentachlorophenol monooxygenase/3-(3-hydroxy-phenyl)propionate hydroxylase
MRFLVPATDAERRHRLTTLDRAAADPAARAAVDSGRLAEPFWYAASPLTTPDPARPFAGRPARGTVPPPGPGILVPDVPVFYPERDGAATLRAVAREGFVVLCACGADAAAARTAASAVAAPVRVIEAGGLEDAGPLAASGLAEAGEVWVIRPDAHAAAVLHDPGAAPIEAALRRALGMVPAEAS